MSEVIKLSELIRPTDRQREFFKAVDESKFVLYGGAKGGGKSYILRWALIRQLLKWAQQGHRNVRAALFCEDFPALKDRQVSKIQIEFPKWLGNLSDSNILGLSFRLKEKYGGGVLALRNLDDPSKYASSEFAAAAVDELTKNEKTVFDQLRSIIRWPGIDKTKFMGGTNPGGIGHAWVKQLWIDRDFDEHEPEPEQFRFVQAFASDNPHLSLEYVKSLGGLPEALRKAYLDGDWNVYEGQFFSEWRDSIHVCEPFEIPAAWRRIRVIDHGRTNPTACMWGAIGHDGEIYWYREYYKKGLDADVNALAIHDLSVGEKYWFTVLDSACYSKTGTGETIAEIYHRNGVIAEPSPKDRVAGWNLFHEYLRPQPLNGEAVPKMKFFKTCINAIKFIPTLIHDELDPEDLDTRGEDHAADAISYGLQFMHEARSPKPKEAIELMLERVRKKTRVGPSSLNNFYGRR